MNLGSTIKYVREAKGLRQGIAAHALGISGWHMSTLERDHCQPSLRLLDKMREAWGVDIYILAWLRQGGDTPGLPLLKDDSCSLRRTRNAWECMLESEGDGET